VGRDYRQGFSEDASGAMRMYERSGRDVPITFVRHTMRHSCDESRKSDNLADVTICVHGQEHSSEGVQGNGPVHALDEAIREALAKSYSGLCVKSVHYTGFRAEGHFDDPDVPPGLHVDAAVTIGFVAAVDESTDQLVDLKEKGPAIRHVRWSARAEGADLIDASIQALGDGYNWFALNVLSCVSKIQAPVTGTLAAL